MQITTLPNNCDWTSNVTNFSDCFRDCVSLKDEETLRKEGIRKD